MKWIRLWPDYVINGTTFSELNAEQRGVWFSLLAMAGYSPIPGTVCITEGVPYTIDQLCAVLKLPKAILLSSIDELIKCEKLTKNTDGTYVISNWSKYQTEYERQKPYRRGLQGKVTKKGYDQKLQRDVDTDTEVKEEIKTPPLNPPRKRGGKRQGKLELSPKQQGLFDHFWHVYPVKRFKGEAQKAWADITPPPDERLVETMITTIGQAKKSEGWRKNGGERIPNPARWLDAQGWLDDYGKPNLSSTDPPAQSESVGMTPLTPEERRRNQQRAREVRKKLEQGKGMEAEGRQ